MSKYKKINLLGIIIFSALFIINGTGHLLAGKPFLAMLFHQSIAGHLVMAIFFSSLFFLPEKKASYYLQVGIFALIGLAFIVFNEPSRLGGQVIIGFAAFLMYKYGLLSKNRILKLSLLMLIVFVGIAVSLISHNASIHDAFGPFLLLVLTIILMWIIFEEDTRKLLRERNHLEQEIVKSKPFVEFGKNTAGLAHDLKNDLSLLSAFSELMESKAEKRLIVEEEDITKLERYIERLSHRIEMIRYVTSASGKIDIEDVNLITLLESVIYIFQIKTEFRHKVQIRLHGDGEYHIKSRRDHLLQIFENLIGNSCEAIVERDDSCPHSIDVFVTGYDSSTKITIIDTGGGISFLKNDEEEKRVDNSEFFIGRSTKSTGSGYGMYNVQTRLKDLGGSLNIFSKKGKGVRAEVILPQQCLIKKEKET